MKTSIYSIILTGLLFTSLTGFSKELSKEFVFEKSVKVPAAAAVNFQEDFVAPLYLKNIKAKNGMVPLAPFCMGLANEIELLKASYVPIPEIIMGDSDTNAPEGLKVKVRFLSVPLAPFEMGDPASL